MRTIKQILMDRDGMSAQDADAQIIEATEDLSFRLARGETADDICEEWFGLEPDYIWELM